MTDPTPEPVERTDGEIIAFWVITCFFILICLGLAYSIPWLVDQRNDGALLLAFMVIVVLPIISWTYYSKVYLPFWRK